MSVESKYVKKNIDFFTFTRYVNSYEKGLV